MQFMGSVAERPPLAAGRDTADNALAQHSPSVSMLRWHGRLAFTCKLLLAVAVIGWLVWSGRLDFAAFARIGLTADLAWLAAIVFASLALPAVRWWWLLRIQHLDVSFGRAVSMTWAGYAAGLVLPGAASGDLAKGYLILRGRKEARFRALSTILLDRFLGLYALLILGTAGGIWLASRQDFDRTTMKLCISLGALLALGAALVLVMALAPSSRLAAHLLPSNWLEAWKQSHELYERSKTALAGCLVLSLASGMLTTASLTLADRMFGGALGWLAGLVVGPLVILANCLPFSVGGFGVGEAAASALFGQMGSSHGAEAMLLVRLAIAVCSLLGFGAALATRDETLGTAVLDAEPDAV